MAAPSWTGDIHVGTLGDQNPRLGRKVRTADGSEYIWMKGVASLVLGDWVTFNGSSYATVRLIADAVGPVAIAMSANTVTTNQSWYQIAGINTVSNSDTVAGANVPLFIDGTTGRVDDAVVTGDMVVNAFPTAADTTNVLPVYIFYPCVTNSLG